MDAEQIKAFRTNFRLELIERLALRAALVEPVLARVLSMNDSSQALQGWLDQNAQVILETVGAELQDAGLTALYAEEAKEVCEDMKKKVKKMEAEGAPIARRFS